MKNNSSLFDPKINPNIKFTQYTSSTIAYKSNIDPNIHVKKHSKIIVNDKKDEKFQSFYIDPNGNINKKQYKLIK